MALLLKNARFVDPAVDLDRVCDMVIRDGSIVEIGEDLSIPKGEKLDLSGQVVIPGMVDLHVHLREPGQEYKEDIASGSRAAAKGGFTDVCCMPNTSPVADIGSVISFMKEKAEEANLVRVHPIGAITRELQGKELAEIGDMHEAGAVAFSDDGRGVQSGGMLRTAMDYVKQFGAPVISHCEDESIVGKGVVNEGVVSTRLGLSGWPSQGEEVQVERDIELGELTGCAVHIAHITTARAVDAVKRGKERGVAVTCEVTPHHLFLSEDDISTEYDTSYKMNPPLRTAEDAAALRDALIDGTIDAVATDHAPHARHEKAREFELAPFGIIGLETCLPLLITHLVEPGHMSLDRLVEVMCHNPRKIVGLDPVTLEPGSKADLTVFDPEGTTTVDEDLIESKSINTPFLGQQLEGRVTHTILEGYASLVDGSVVDR